MAQATATRPRPWPRPPRAVCRSSACVVTFVVGLIVFLPFPSWQQLVGFITSATVLSFGSGPDRAGGDAPRDPGPGAPVPAPVRRRDPVPGVLLVQPDRLLGRLGRELEAVRRGRPRASSLLASSTSPAGRPCRAWTGGPARPGSLPWLGGLCLISYLGDYPDKSEPTPATRGLLGFGWGFVVLLALTRDRVRARARVRLPRDRVEQNIEATKAEARPRTARAPAAERART